MKHREFKDRLYAQFARIGKGLASPARLELLDLLAQGERTVEALARETTLTVANTSAHLQVLREARLVEARKEGLYVHYRLADESVGALTRTMRGVAERQLAEVDRVVKSYLGDRHDLDAISAAKLAERIKDGTVLVIDVRPAEEYAAGHIAGALSVPHDELVRRMKEIPRDQEIVAYCRGPYCVFADEAIATLRKHRRIARRLAEGFPEWRAAGLPTESVHREATR
ncbi:MAG: metalloregulator ArsR/SmtB family transcription factor [Polyangiales bacterium]